ncbi:flagellar basal body P-ring protein FlgI [Andreprevotia chitinilytica]|uniref:flagellar basal body P-ring protein FlgI n=1 Tax=Andreprevotia chitinilytica TaxID=396808 RepID=UPI000551C296|nr:flagellar basal body P-ring protein FlgI [Andreprevotia chitinilytica]
MRRFLVLFFLLSSPLMAAELQLRNIGRFDGWKENYLSGIGLVSGLANTGDSARNKTTRQALANLMSRFDLNVQDSQITSRNVASVIVTATLPAVSRPGDRIDVTVTSMGDAKSLVGGALLLTPLKGPNGRIYCLAQGALNVGGYRAESHDSLVQQNHPTVGLIPGGCTVEQGTQIDPQPANGLLRFVLNQPDYVMSASVAAKVRKTLPQLNAVSRDAGLVEIQLPQYVAPDQLVELIASIEAVRVEPVNQIKVVVNERSGVVVAGAQTVISPIAVSYGNLRISINSTSIVAQPLLVINSPDTRASITRDSTIKATEAGASVITRPGNTVADLVALLNAQRVSARDMIAILQAIKASGALYADIVVQ